MLNVVAYKIAVIILAVSLVGASSTAVYYHDQQGNQISKAADLNTQVSSLQSQISSLNSQISQLNTQVSQLQALNNQLGGTNSQLVSQIQQFQTQITQLQAQVSQLQTQLNNLNAILKLQQSRTIASESQMPNSPLTTVDLGVLTYSGYIRVSWTGGAGLAFPKALVSFTIQEFDVNITTPTMVSGVFSIPVSANATGNAWFSVVNCPEAGFCPGFPVTYSITYWY
jgi:prefoldin subunit 5